MARESYPKVVAVAPLVGLQELLFRVVVIGQGERHAVDLEHQEVRRHSSGEEERRRGCRGGEKERRRGWRGGEDEEKEVLKCLLEDEREEKRG